MNTCSGQGISVLQHGSASFSHHPKAGLPQPAWPNSTSHWSPQSILFFHNTRFTPFCCLQLLNFTLTCPLQQNFPKYKCFVLDSCGPHLLFRQPCASGPALVLAVGLGVGSCSWLCYMTQRTDSLDPGLLSHQGRVGASPYCINVHHMPKSCAMRLENLHFKFISQIVVM